MKFRVPLVFLWHSMRQIQAKAVLEEPAWYFWQRIWWKRDSGNRWISYTLYSPLMFLGHSLESLKYHLWSLPAWTFPGCVCQLGRKCTFLYKAVTDTKTLMSLRDYFGIMWTGNLPMGHSMFLWTLVTKTCFPSYPPPVGSRFLLWYWYEVWWCLHPIPCDY